MTVTYTIDLLTSTPDHTQEENPVDDYDVAIGLAQEFYFQVATDDAEHVVGVWTQDYDLVAIIFAGQVFVPEPQPVHT